MSRVITLIPQNIKGECKLHLETKKENSTHPLEQLLSRNIESHFPWRGIKKVKLEFQYELPEC